MVDPRFVASVFFTILGSKSCVASVARLLGFGPLGFGFRV